MNLNITPSRKTVYEDKFRSWYYHRFAVKIKLNFWEVGCYKSKPHNLKFAWIILLYQVYVIDAVITVDASQITNCTVPTDSFSGISDFRSSSSLLTPKINQGS